MSELKEFKKVIYGKEQTAMEKYNTIKEDFDKYIQKLFKAKNYDEISEAQAHMENLLMDCVTEINGEDAKGLEGTLNTIFVKYDYVNKYNISILPNGEKTPLLKGRIVTESRVKELKALGFYERRAN